MQAEFFLVMRYNPLRMETVPNRKNITSRIIRNGDFPPENHSWDRVTPEERIEAVWNLTLLCLAWRSDQFDEPRLQRSVSRVQRPER
jgi:hypothetical protein